MRKPPKIVQPLLELTGNPKTTVAELRAALAAQDIERLKRNGYHVIMALSDLDDLADIAIKFACVHEALGTDRSVNAEILTAQWSHKGEYRMLTDAEACRVVRFLLDEKLMQPFPGLLYQACGMGLRECAKMIFAAGIYAPLPRHWVSVAGPAEEERFAKLLLDVAAPSLQDLRIIRTSFKDGSVGAAIVDAAIRKGSTSRLH